MRARWWISVAALAGAGCGTTVDTVETPAPAKPVLDVPAALSVGEGKNLVIAHPTSSAGATVVASASGLVKVSVSDGAITVDTSYGQTGKATLTVTATLGGESTTATSSLTVVPLKWGVSTTWDSGPGGPEAREHGALLVDAKAGKVLLFGGSGYNPYLTPLGDAWLYDLQGTSWASVTPSGDVPSGGGSRRVAPVPSASGARAYLFGGYGKGGAAHAELYRVDLDGGKVAFTLVKQQNPPPKRALHAFFYDAQDDAFYAFGGADAKIYDDTWRMRLMGDIAVWEPLALSPRPSPRYGFFYGYDAAARRLVVYSGAQGTQSVNPARDTWALDLAGGPHWTQLAQGDAVPPGRRNGCMVLDPSAPRLVVFGGTADAMTSEPGLWLFDMRAGHGDWRQVQSTGEPAIRSSGIGFYDEKNETIRVGFGNTTMKVFRDWNALGY